MRPGLEVSKIDRPESLSLSAWETGVRAEDGTGAPSVVNMCLSMVTLVYKGNDEHCCSLNSTSRVNTYFMCLSIGGSALMAEKHEHEVEIEQEPDKGLHCSFLHSEVILTPPSPWPFRSFAGETIIVTGSGLGYEAARHFYRLDCAKLILAVRTVARGNEAKHNIIHSVRHRTDGASAIKVWHLDLFSTGSTLAFTKRVTNKLDRVDRLIENADISPTHFDLVEGVESTIQVNVLNTLLLALLLLPKLRETKVKFPTAQPHLTIVSSEVQNFKAVPESRAWDLYSSLSDDKTSRMCTR